MRGSRRLKASFYYLFVVLMILNGYYFYKGGVIVTSCDCSSARGINFFSNNKTKNVHNILDILVPDQTETDANINKNGKKLPKPTQILNLIGCKTLKSRFKASHNFTSYVNWEKEYKFAINNFDYPSSGDLSQILVLKRSNRSLENISVFNPYIHEISRTPKNVCVEDTQILFLIKSALPNLSVRQTIRETWGSIPEVSNRKLKYIFVVGSPADSSKNNSQQKELDSELEKHGDILQISSVDSYYNNTLKTLGAMKFVVEKCQLKPKFLFFVDDDFYVNTELLSNFAEKEITGKRQEKLYLGMVVQSVPGRYKGGKWYVSLSDYKYSKYPPFLRAGAMLMSPDTVEDLYIASSYVKRFKFDDVYLAIIAYKLKMKPRDCTYMFLDRIGPKDKRFCKTIASHWYNEKDIREAWAFQNS